MIVLNSIEDSVGFVRMYYSDKGLRQEVGYYIQKFYVKSKTLLEFM